MGPLDQVLTVDGTGGAVVQPVDLIVGVEDHAVVFVAHGHMVGVEGTCANVDGDVDQVLQVLHEVGREYAERLSQHYQQTDQE